MDFESNYKKICAEKTHYEVFLDKFNTPPNSLSDFSRIQFVMVMAKTFKMDFLLKQPFVLHERAHSKPLKSANFSISDGLEGNENYKKKLYQEAIDCYNQSVLEGEGKSLALAYANRSMVFHSTKDWLHSLRDIQLALDHGYPKHLEHKLRERQGNCWSKLGNVNQALISFSLARDLLVNSSHKDDQSDRKLADIVSKINNLGSMEAVDSTQLISDVKTIEEDIMKKRRLPPKLNGEKNPLIPCASTSIKLSSSPGRGRCLVATEDLKPGATVIVEKAFTSILENEFKETHCHFCLHWTPGPVACLRCSQVGFCSTLCRDKAWSSYHKSECGLIDVLSRTGVTETTLLALRTVLMMDRNILLNVPEQLPTDGIYDCTKYETIHHLDGNTAKRSTSDLFRRSILAFYLICLVKGEVDLKLSAALLRLLQSYPCNSHSVEIMFLPPPSHPIEAIKLSPTCIGAAIMPVSSLMNHSCNPNITRNCYGDVMAITVICPIKRGDEILDCYGPHFFGHPKESRQIKLNKLHLFQCSCPACDEDWPQMDNIPSLANKPKLNLALLKDMKKFGRRPCFYSDSLDELQNWAAKFISYLNKVDGDRAIRRPIREYTETQEALKHCYDLMATVSPQIPKQQVASSTDLIDLLKSLRMSN